MRDTPALVVLDANVFIAAFWNPRSASAGLIEACRRGDLRLATSPTIEREALSNLSRARASREFIQDAAGLMRQARRVSPRRRVRLVEDDPADNRLVECALAAGADFLVSSDHHLLSLGQVDRVSVLSPGALSRRLAGISVRRREGFSMFIPWPLRRKLAAVRLLALDVDGVLTDGSVCMGPAGELAKSFHAHDGLAIARARRAGLEIALLSGRVSQPAAARAAELGIEVVLQGLKDKVTPLQKLAAERGLEMGGVAFMGDDLADLGAIRAAGLGLAPANAAAEIRRQADYLCQRSGGRGAVREVIELILRAQGKWRLAAEPPPETSL